MGDRASRLVAGVAHHFLHMARPGVRLLEAGAANTAGISSWKSTTAAFSLTQALVMEAALKSPSARDRLSRAERIWSDLSIYLE